MICAVGARLLLLLARLEGQQSISWRVLLGLWAVGLGTLGQVDSSVNIAFPAIVAWFGIDISAVQWLVIAYLLPMSSLVLIFGKLGDLYGHRRIFALGLLVSIVAHSLSGLAPDYDLLLLLRVLQGIGFGLIVASASTQTYRSDMFVEVDG